MQTTITKYCAFILVLTALLTSCRKDEQNATGSAWHIGHRSQTAIKFENNYYAALWWYGYKGLGFYDEPVRPENELWLNQLAPLLAELNTPTPLLSGPLQKFLYQFPTYLNPRNPDELQKICNASRQFMRDGSITAYTNTWPRMTHFWDQWFCEPSLKLMRASYAGQEETIFRIMEIWAAYMRELWPKYQEIYDEKIKKYDPEDYQERFDELGLLSFWQRQFGTPYPYDEFHVIICPDCPTLAGRIGPEKIVIGAKYSWENISNAVTHEVGYRFPSLNRLSQEPSTRELVNCDPIGVMRLIETEVCVRKLELLTDLKNDAYVTSLGLQNLVNWRVLVELDTTFEASLPSLYAKAKDAGLL